MAENEILEIAESKLKSAEIGWKLAEISNFWLENVENRLKSVKILENLDNRLKNAEIGSKLCKIGHQGLTNGLKQQKRVQNLLEPIKTIEV